MIIYKQISSDALAEATREEVSSKRLPGNDNEGGATIVNENYIV